MGLRIERSGEPAKAVADHLSTSAASQEAKEADCKTESIPIQAVDHPDGELGAHVNRHRQRYVQRMFLRSRRRCRRALVRRPQRVPQLAAA